MINAVSSLALPIMQSPEVARQQAQIAGQTALQNAQRPALIAHDDRQTDETVLAVAPARFAAVASVLSGTAARQNPTYHRQLRHDRVQLATAVNAIGSDSLGSNVDVRV